MRLQLDSALSGTDPTKSGATTGGFLQTATNLLTAIEDPATGAIKTEEASVAAEISTAQTNLNSEQARVTQLQTTNLTQQISQADSTIAELESQVSYVTGLLANTPGPTTRKAVSQLFEILDCVASIKESARRGDWRSAPQLTAILPRALPPASREELGEYLDHLKDALAVAKASRAHAAASQVRLNAAARFNRSRSDFSSGRQNFGDSADFQQPARVVE